MFGYDDKILNHIHTSIQTFEKHVDLLLSWNTENSHYFLVKYFNRFITSKIIMVKTNIKIVTLEY